MRNNSGVILFLLIFGQHPGSQSKRHPTQPNAPRPFHSSLIFNPLSRGRGKREGDKRWQEKPPSLSSHLITFTFAFSGPFLFVRLLLLLLLVLDWLNIQRQREWGWGSEAPFSWLLPLHMPATVHETQRERERGKKPICENFRRQAGRLCPLKEKEPNAAIKHWLTFMLIYI